MKKTLIITLVSCSVLIFSHLAEAQPNISFDLNLYDTNTGEGITTETSRMSLNFMLTNNTNIDHGDYTFFFAQDINIYPINPEEKETKSLKFPIDRIVSEIYISPHLKYLDPNTISFWLKESTINPEKLSPGIYMLECTADLSVGSTKIEEPENWLTSYPDKSSNRITINKIFTVKPPSLYNKWNAAGILAMSEANLFNENNIQIFDGSNNKLNTILNANLNLNNLKILSKAGINWPNIKEMFDTKILWYKLNDINKE